VKDVEELRKRGYLTAPESAIHQAVITVRWMCSRFGGVPFILGGFSQGSMLATQCLSELRRSQIFPAGVLVLSGLVAHVDMPHGVKCLVIHGTKDKRIPISVVHKALDTHKQSMMHLQEISGLGHEISDAVLEHTVSFCDEVASVGSELVSIDESDKALEKRQAGLLRWVKNISQVITMFDDERFLSHIFRLDMVGLGTECPSLANGLFRYKLIKPERTSRGIVILWHGKERNLIKDTQRLVDAYVRLELSVCIVAYRQKFSQLCVDAQILLDSLSEVAGEAQPIIIHCIGIGAVPGLHMTLASHTLPIAIQKRFRVLVLDGAVGNFKALPPSPTGCIATDPIGNDAKLSYVNMPLAIYGGDDACCGLTRTHGHFTVLSNAARSLEKEGKMPMLMISEEKTVSEAAVAGCLEPELCQLIVDNLDNSRVLDTTKTHKFIDDVLGTDPDAMPSENVTERTLEKLCNKVIEACKTHREIQERLWTVYLMDEPQRGREHMRLIIAVLNPILQEVGGFKDGADGFRQFEHALSLKSSPGSDLAKLHEEVRKCFDIKQIAIKVMHLEREEVHKVKHAVLHQAIARCLEEWRSEALHEQVMNRISEAGGNTQATRTVMKALKSEMNLKAASWMGLKGSDQEIDSQLQAVARIYMEHDPALQKKMSDITREVTELTSRLFQTTPAQFELFRQKSKTREVLQQQPQQQQPQQLQQPAKTPVQVVVEHATEGGSLTVTVQSTASVLDLRKAIMSALGVSKLSSIKLVTRTELLMQTIPDDTKLKNARNFLMMGPSLLPNELDVTIFADRSFGIKTTIKVKAGSTIKTLKQLLAQADSTGSTEVEKISLSPPGCRDEPLSDDQVVTAELTTLDVSEVSPSNVETEAPNALVGEAQMQTFEIVVHIDQILGIKTNVVLRPGDTIKKVKDHIVEADPTGSTKAEDFGLRPFEAGESVAPLADDTPITSKLQQLEICLPH